MSLTWKTEGMNYFHLLLPQHLAPLWERLNPHPFTSGARVSPDLTLNYD